MTNGGSPDIVAHFKAGFETVKRYPILVLPPLAVHVLLFLVLFFVWGGTIGLGALMGGAMGGGGGAVAGGAAGLVAGFLLFMVVSTLLSLLASGVVVLMARDALAGREPAIGAAIGAVMGRATDVILASFLVTLIVGIGMILLVIPGVIAAFLLLFTLPAVLLDAQGAVDGLKRSVAVVKANVGPVLGFLIGAILVAVGGAIVGWIIGHVPVLGALAMAVVNGALISYLTVVGVRLYQALPRG
jgi:hypothetical protein